MNDNTQPYYSIAFIEEGDKTYVLFYDSEDNLVLNRKILIETLQRLSG